MTPTKLSLDSILDRGIDVVSGRVRERGALFDLRSGRAFELDPIGVRVFGDAGERPLQATFDALLFEYDVAPDVLEEKLLRIASELVASGVLMVRRVNR
jgi:hypothetical protein